MLYFAQLQAASTEAQRNLAGMMGKADSAAGNAIWNQLAITVVWGLPQPVQDMLPDGGYRGMTSLLVGATRDQFPAPPTGTTYAKMFNRTQIVRMDVVPQIIYRIEMAYFHDPLKFVFNCISVGE